MGNDEIEMDAFTILQDMALSNDLEVIISRFSDLLRELGVRHKLTPQELAALIYLANERLAVKTSMMFYSYSDTFMIEDPNPDEKNPLGYHPGLKLHPPRKPPMIDPPEESSGSGFYQASMERSYGLRICSHCGHENRHPGKYCDNCKKYLKSSFMIKCPRCGGDIRKGNRCDHCNASIPPCYGVKAPRSQDCANCVYTVQCLEEQHRSLKTPLNWCRNCRHVNPSGVTRCEKCGYDLLTGEPADIQRCPKCGETYSPKPGVVMLKCLDCDADMWPEEDPDEELNEEDE